MCVIFTSSCKVIVEAFSSQTPDWNEQTCNVGGSIIKPGACLRTGGRRECVPCARKSYRIPCTSVMCRAATFQRKAEITVQGSAEARTRERTRERHGAPSSGVTRQQGAGEHARRAAPLFNRSAPLPHLRVAPRAESTNVCCCLAS